MTDSQDSATTSHDLLIEIGCEELPPKALDTLRKSLFASLCQALENHNITFSRSDSRAWSTPRRLAVFLSEVAAQQPDVDQERRGPAVQAAYDAEGRPTAAAEGFARSVGRPVETLETLKTDKGEWLYCRMLVPGKPLQEVLQAALEQALKQLPVPRPMRWADHDFSFVRPVHWLLVLHGDTLLSVNVLGKQAGRTTLGHRVHGPGPHVLANASEYLETLRRAHVLADQDERRDNIRQGTLAVAPAALIDPTLLQEVTNLVEWPVAIACSFDEAFLQVPHAALIASMQDHQKFFPVQSQGSDDAEGPAGNVSISNSFVAIANLDSKDIDAVRCGFERVMRPRLADAQFFFEQDQKISLASYGGQLDRVVYQENIGTLGDKSRRLASLSREIADLIGSDGSVASRAGELAKCDLVTQMVGEFPELQGTMGRFYAALSDEPDDVAVAIGEHYSPRFSGDAIPLSPAGQIVSLADRIDTLVGIFAAGLKPTGNRDPFALRRSALGLVRILLEAKLNLNVDQLMQLGALSLAPRIDVSEKLQTEIRHFINQRAKNHFQALGFTVELINAASSAPWTTFDDLYVRLRALVEFMGSEAGSSLAAANKRIGNILRKAEHDVIGEINEDALLLGEERRLFDELIASESDLVPLLAKGAYDAALGRLAALRTPVDRFFDEVMVMDEDRRTRTNRLALLSRLKQQFDQIADLSVLA